MNLRKLNDFELIYLYKEGNFDVLELLLKKYLGLIHKISLKYYTAYKYIGIDLDDLIQESKIAFYDAIRRFDDDKSLLYSFVILCVESRVRSYCNAYNNLKNYPLNNSSGDCVLEQTIKYGSENVDDILIENETYFECKNVLDFKYSIIFELKINGFKLKEISTLLDIPFSTLDGRLTTIKRQLKRELNLEI